MTKGARGRPAKLVADKETVEAIELLVEIFDASTDDLARWFHVHPDTVTRFLTRNQRAHSAWLRGKRRARVIPSCSAV